MILLTGATGNVGSAAAQALVAKRIKFRVLVRDAAKLPEHVREHADVHVGDLTRHEDVAHGLEGVSNALLVTPNGEPQADIETAFVDSAVQCGVKQLVKVSSMEAAPDAASAIPLAHYQTEQRIRASNLGWTLLRPNFFMQNLLLYAAAVRATSTLPLPLGRARVAMIDARDVGRAAAVALTESGHENRCYELSGPALTDFHQVAQILSTEAGAEIAYVEQSLGDFRASLSQFIPSSWQVDALVALFGTIAGGALERSSSDIANILGEPANTLERFAKEYAAVFSASATN
ncbi:MAG: SDR family oxidoreductase [Pseudomonadota bacterium]